MKDADDSKLDIRKSRSSRTQIISNSLYSVGAFTVTLPLSLIVNSFVVHQLGRETYGIWASLITILGYGSLLDLGITTPLIKYVAEYMALGRKRDINVLLSTAMVFYGAVGALFLLAMSLASGWILTRVFHTASHGSGVRNLYFAILVGFVVSLPFSVLQSLIRGLQRTDITARLDVAFSVLSSILILALVRAGLGVNGLGIAWIVTTTLIVVRNWFVAKRLLPSLVLNPLLFRSSRLRHILAFSTRVQIASITLVLNDQVDRTLIAYVFGPSMLAFYALAATLTSAVRGVSFALVAGVLPAASDLAALREDERLRLLYLRASRYLAIYDVGACAGASVLAGPLVALWLGPGYGRVASTVVLILAGYLVWLPSQATTEPLNGLGRPEIRMRADVAFLCLHIPLSVILIWQFGYFGTVVGTSLALATTRVYVYVVGARVIGVPGMTLVRTCLLHPLLGGVLALSVALAVGHLLTQPPLPLLLLQGVGFFVVYFGYLALFGLDPYDRAFLRSQMATIKRLLAAS